MPSAADRPTAGDDLDLEEEERLIAEAGGWTTWDGSGDAHVMEVGYVPQGWREGEGDELEPPPLDDGEEARRRRQVYDNVARSEGRSSTDLTVPDRVDTTARMYHDRDTRPRRGRTHPPRPEELERGRTFIPPSIRQGVMEVMLDLGLSREQIEAVLDEVTGVEPPYTLQVRMQRTHFAWTYRVIVEQRYPVRQRWTATLSISDQALERAHSPEVVLFDRLSLVLDTLLRQAGIDAEWAIFLHRSLRMLWQNSGGRFAQPAPPTERGIRGARPYLQIVDEIAEMRERRRADTAQAARQQQPWDDPQHDVVADVAAAVRQVEATRPGGPQDAPRDEDVVVGTQDASEEEFLAAMQDQEE